MLPDFRDEALDKGLGGDLPVGQPKVVGPPIHRKYAVVLTDLDERGTDRSAAAEAMAIGRGGITAVAEATGLPRSSIQIRIKEL